MLSIEIVTAPQLLPSKCALIDGDSAQDCVSDCWTPRYLDSDVLHPSIATSCLAALESIARENPKAQLERVSLGSE